jgi:tetratricopeptide (TPR) repeat protein
MWSLMMEDNHTDYPKRPREHIIGDRAVDVFKIRLPIDWIKNESKKDYGWDIWLTITRNNKARENFFVQLKGSDNPNYIENNIIISQVLNVPTVNWLLELPMPIMLCICDTGKIDEPVYYVWLQEDLKRIEKENPNWRKQDSVSFHIPISQIVSNDNKNEIQEYVEKYYNDLKINIAIGKMLSPSFGFEKSEPISLFTKSADKVVSEKISSVMMDAGIIDVVEEGDETSIEALSIDDQRKFREIKKTSIALDSFRDKDALKILDDLEFEIENSSEGIKARYYNNRGVLSLHLRDYKTAFKLFQKAEKLRPKEPKYIANFLLTDFLSKIDKDHKRFRFSNTWINKLEKLLSEHPDSKQAIRLKATYLGFTEKAEVAEKYLRSTKNWDEECVSYCCELSDLYIHENNINKSIELLAELEKKEKGLNWSFWGLYGTTLLQKALGQKCYQSNNIIYGPGPSLLDIKVLRKSEECLIKACEDASYVGFPLVSQMAVANLAVVQRLLGKTDEAKHFANAFLIQHPNNPEVATAYLGCLITEDDIPSTIKYSKIAYEADCKNKTNYQNYLISIYQAEDYDSLIKLVSSRKEKSFTDEDEESLSLSLYSIALNEIGEENKAIDTIKEMKRKSSMVRET